MAGPPTVSGPYSARSAMNSLLRGDFALAVGLILILMFMLVPMPAWVVDIGLAISITFSIVILMITLFIRRPLEFSTFPTILLISTALRLGLNIASTRLILSGGSEGHDAAGKIIQAFGTFMIQGNYVVGAIVFAILVIVNFIVITKGSGRIAEVAARFSLDAMPGKQMAIDSDLSAGLITEADAKLKRSELQQESSFFGAMDGAAKFVRGDAIAGLLIVFINLIGGIIIGTVSKDMSLSDAADNYTILTIGEGLVAQIPALIVSVAAGLLVSKAGVEGTADEALMDQFSRYPRATAMSSGLMVIIGFMPGMPDSSLSWLWLVSRVPFPISPSNASKSRQTVIIYESQSRHHCRQTCRRPHFKIFGDGYHPARTGVCSLAVLCKEKAEPNFPIRSKACAVNLPKIWGIFSPQFAFRIICNFPPTPTLSASKKSKRDAAMFARECCYAWTQPEKPLPSREKSRLNQLSVCPPCGLMNDIGKKLISKAIPLSMRQPW
jgi:flagellar biosynthesis component FlhA